MVSIRDQILILVSSAREYIIYRNSTYVIIDQYYVFNHKNLQNQAKSNTLYV
jgi:hypothetical protein